jgi:hypothetical protein
VYRKEFFIFIFLLFFLIPGVISLSSLLVTNITIGSVGIIILSTIIVFLLLTIFGLFIVLTLNNKTLILDSIRIYFSKLNLKKVQLKWTKEVHLFGK